MSCRKWLWIMALLAGVVCACQCDGRVRGVAVLCQTPEVWHQPEGKQPTEVIQDTQAGKGDQVSTGEHGQALLKWPDLWVRLYYDTELHWEEECPTDVCMTQKAGKILAGGTRPWRLNTDNASIEIIGSMVMVAYHRGKRLTVVRAFDGQAEVRNLTGDVQESKPVSADEWARVEPDKVPTVSNRLEEMRDLAEELGLWDVFHQVERDVRDGWGPDESRVSPALVTIVFVTPTPTWTPTPTVKPTPTQTAIPTKTPTPTPSPTPTQCQFPVDPELSAAWERDTFGCAHSEAKIIWAAWQSFEKGHMLWRSDTNQVISFYKDDETGKGTSEPWEDRWDGHDESIKPRATPPPGKLAPVRGFGYLWGEHDELFKALGWALKEERGFCARIQDFDTGLIFHSSQVKFCRDNKYNWATSPDWTTLFFAVRADGTWLRY